MGLLKAYLTVLPELHAEDQLQASQVASVPHMKPTDRRQLTRSWRRRLPRPKARTPRPDDLAGIGIAVEEAPSG